jgi:hypothetical protein
MSVDEWADLGAPSVDATPIFHHHLMAAIAASVGKKQGLARLK